MELTKIRNWNDDELKGEAAKASEQLFRIRFQAKLGQNEGVKKLRDLRKDIARIKTVAREPPWGFAARQARLARPRRKRRPGKR